MADEVWLDVLPAMGKFGPALIKGANSAAKNAGSQGGKNFKKEFDKGIDGSGDAVIAELEGAQKRASGLVLKLSGDMSTARQQQRRSAAELLLAEQRLTDTVAKFGSESVQAEAATLKLENAREKAAQANSKYSSSEDALRSAQKGLKAVTQQLNTAQTKSNVEVKKAPGLWGKLTTASSAAKSKVGGFAKSLGGVAGSAAAAVGGIALVKEALSQGFEMEAATDQMVAALAATPEQAEIYGKAAGELYSKAYGESMADVTSAVDAVVSSIKGMREASAKDIEILTGKALNLSKAFGVDVAEATTAVGVMMNSGLAKDGTHAMDLITTAMSKVPKQVRGEVLPSLSEYSKHYAALGISGESAINLIIGASEQGVIGVDKMGDAIKEFGIRSTDMSDATAAAFAMINGVDVGAIDKKTKEGQKAMQDMSFEAADMAKQLLAGGETANTAFDNIVSGLKTIENPADQAFAAITLFGTPLEDLGVDKIPAFLEALQPTNAMLSNMAGSADTLGTTLSDNTTTGMEALKRSFMGAITEAFEPFIPYLTSVIDWAVKTPGVLLAVAAALAVLTIGVTAMTLAASPWLAIILGVMAAVAAIIVVIKNWGTIVNWVKDIVSKAASWISEKWNAMGESISRWYKDKIKPIIDAAGKVFTDLYTKFIKPAIDGVKSGWEGMGNALKAGWDWVSDKVIDPFKLGIKTIGEAFGKAIDVVKVQWDKIKGIAAKPINFVIETVYMKGIKGTWDKIADKVGLDLKMPTINPIKFASGGVLPGYTPGRDVHHFTSPTAGGLSLSGGEAIMRPEFTRLVGGEAGVHRLNSLARKGSLGGQRFADGGVWGWMKDKAAGAGKWVAGKAGAAWDWTKNAAASVANFISDPIGAIIDQIGEPVQEMLKGISPGMIGDILSVIPSKVIKSLGFWSKDATEGMTPADGHASAGSGGPSGIGYRAMVSILKKQFPSIGITSTYRPGAVTAVGTPSMHGQGRAVDMAPSMTAFNWIKENFPNSKEIIYSPANGQQVYNGRNHYYGEPTRSMHFDHVHWGMKDGGVVPTLYDNGGVLNPGVTTVLNKTNKPEAILTNAQWSALEDLASQGRISSVGSVAVEISVKDLQGIRTLEEFIAMATRRARQKVGA